MGRKRDKVEGRGARQMEKLEEASSRGREEGIKRRFEHVHS